MKRLTTCIIGTLLVITVTLPAAAATAEQKCFSGRAKAAGKYQGCIQKVLSKFSLGKPLNQTSFSKCRVKYAGAYAKLQKLAGTPCDAPRWVDNGVTVTDNLTGLIWEKKTTDGSVHDVDNLYTWTTSDGDLTDEDGTAFTTFLQMLNDGAGFDGANGWRLPSLAELQTILLPEPFPCTTVPCIDPSFGSTAPPNSSFYWSSTTVPGFPNNAWWGYFLNGTVANDVKTVSVPLRVRAVRAGL